jgi:hypothetical protein
VPTHYDVLGVAPDAAPEELRRAYLELARRLHPDRISSTTSPADADRSVRRMQRVNEAWGVLRDPARRSDYDRALARTTVAALPMSPPARWAPAEDADLGPDPDTPIPHPLAAPGDIGIVIVRIAPWLVLATILVAIYVFTAFARSDRPAADPGRLLDRCVSIDASSVVAASSVIAAVSCDDANDGRVERVVHTSGECPLGSTARHHGSSWLCLVPADPTTPTTATTVP